MRVLMTGANGQLGYCLQQTAPGRLSGGDGPVEIIACTRAQLDLAQVDNIAPVLDKIAPDVVINAAAYTAVDKAEQDHDTANRINTEAVAALASWCENHSAQLVQVSTDFVFDGTNSSPYLTSDGCNPLSVYGASKRRGEEAALNNCRNTYIVRTGWVYAEHGANFVKTMLRLGRERDALSIVSDQIGTPTYARHLAQMIWRLLDVQPVEKIHHFSDAGVASWYDFAVAIFEEARALKLLENLPALTPISSADYPTPARRPTYSVLNKADTWKALDLTPLHWRAALRVMLTHLHTIDQTGLK